MWCDKTIINPFQMYRFFFTANCPIDFSLFPLTKIAELSLSFPARQAYFPAVNHSNDFESTDFQQTLRGMR